jgi:excisionase family DNA binding protein
MNEAPQTYSVPEAARLLGIDPRTLRTAAAAGEIRCFRLGRRWLVPVIEVDRLLGTRESAEK